jgi:hypothetical protein
MNMGGKTMRINHKILSIPPYISASWKNISSLKAEVASATPQNSLFDLYIFLQDGSSVCIPAMDQAIVEAIFTAHAKYLETEISAPKQPPLQMGPFSSETGTALLGGGMNFLLPPELLAVDELKPFVQHSEIHSDFPSLPKELLEKVSNLARSLGIDGVKFVSKAEPHCNCPYCQITRCIAQEIEAKQEELLLEEEVLEEDLRFPSWIIKSLDHHLYEVSHPDYEQKNIVSLQSPIHCSCKNPGCEHIKAVLSS